MIHRHRWTQIAGARCEWFPEQGGSFSYVWVIPSYCERCGKTKDRIKHDQPEWLAPDAWDRVTVDPWGNALPETEEDRLRRIIREEIANEDR